MSTAHPFLPLSLDDEIAEENWEQFENEYKTRYGITEKGGRGSGFFSEEGHVGIPGHQGGSAHEGSGVSNAYASYQLYFEGQKDPEPVKKLGKPEKYISFLGDVTEEQKEKSLKYIKAWNDEIKKQTGIDVSDISTNIVVCKNHSLLCGKAADIYLKENEMFRGSLLGYIPSTKSDIAKEREKYIRQYDGIAFQSKNTNEICIVMPTTDNGRFETKNGSKYSSYKVYLHEVGHALHKSWMPQSAKVKWSSQYNKNPNFDRETEYSQDDEGGVLEAFAETFTSFMLSGGVSEVYKKEFGVIRKMLGWQTKTKGGKGSGFFAKSGHVGIIGHQGGSAHEGSGISSSSYDDEYKRMMRLRKETLLTLKTALLEIEKNVRTIGDMGKMSVIVEKTMSDFGFKEIKIDGSKYINKKIIGFAKQFRKSDIENGLLVDVESGETILEKMGEQSSLEFTDKEMKLCGDGKILIHNHPSGSSFSGEDIAFSFFANLDAVMCTSTKQIITKSGSLSDKNVICVIETKVLGDKLTGNDRISKRGGILAFEETVDAMMKNSFQGIYNMCTSSDFKAYINKAHVRLANASIAKLFGFTYSEVMA